MAKILKCVIDLGSEGHYCMRRFSRQLKHFRELQCPWNFLCIQPCSFRERFNQQSCLKKLYFYSQASIETMLVHMYTQLPACRPLLPLALSVWIQSWELNPRWFSWKDFARLVLPFMPPRRSFGKTEKKRKREREAGWDGDRWHSRWDSLALVGEGYKEMEWVKRWMEGDAEIGIKVQVWGRYAGISWQRITA